MAPFLFPVLIVFNLIYLFAGRLPTCPREKVKNNRQDVNWKVFEKVNVVYILLNFMLVKQRGLLKAVHFCSKKFRTKKPGLARNLQRLPD